jgi:hypothetical protein
MGFEILRFAQYGRSTPKDESRTLFFRWIASVSMSALLTHNALAHQRKDFVGSLRSFIVIGDVCVPVGASKRYLDGG